MSPALRKSGSSRPDDDTQAEGALLSESGRIFRYQDSAAWWKILSSAFRWGETTQATRNRSLFKEMDREKSINFLEYALGDPQVHFVDIKAVMFSDVWCYLDCRENIIYLLTRLLYRTEIFD